jgi:diacylglycerol kinase family enzyme
MRILIIHNPRSGLQDGAIFTFIRHFSRDLDEVVIRIMDETTPIAEYVSDVHTFNLVVAAGGDGTISGVCYAMQGNVVPILPFPSGTGNLLVTNLDLPVEPVALAALARRPYALEFDLGEIEYQDENSQLQTRGFVVAAGAGFDAEVLKAAENMKKNFGSGAYILAAVSRANPTYARFTLELDNEIVTTEGIAVLLLNFAKIAPDLSITHATSARDGLLDIAILRPHSTVELLPALLSALFDRAGGYPKRGSSIDTYSSRSVRVTADPMLPIQYDGEVPVSFTPVSARILPLSTRLIVPELTYRSFMDRDNFHF